MRVFEDCGSFIKYSSWSISPVLAPSLVESLVECRLFQSWPRFSPNSERNFPSKLPFCLCSLSLPFLFRFHEIPEGWFRYAHLDLDGRLTINSQVKTRERRRLDSNRFEREIDIVSRSNCVRDDDSNWVTLFRYRIDPRAKLALTFQRKRGEDLVGDFTASIFHRLVDLLFRGQIALCVPTRGKRIVYGGKATPQLDFVD